MVNNIYRVVYHTLTYLRSPYQHQGTRGYIHQPADWGRLAGDDGVEGEAAAEWDPARDPSSSSAPASASAWEVGVSGHYSQASLSGSLRNPYSQAVAESHSGHAVPPPPPTAAAMVVQSSDSSGIGTNSNSGGLGYSLAVASNRGGDESSRMTRYSMI